MMWWMKEMVGAALKLSRLLFSSLLPLKVLRALCRLLLLQLKRQFYPFQHFLCIQLLIISTAVRHEGEVFSSFVQHVPLSKPGHHLKTLVCNHFYCKGVTHLSVLN